jgi:transaldolase
MPPNTLRAFKQHGHAKETITASTQAARTHMARLEELGIDMAAVTDKLEADGVAAFAQSFEDLLAVIEQRSRPLHPARAQGLSAGAAEAIRGCSGF